MKKKLLALTLAVLLLIAAFPMTAQAVIARSDSDVAIPQKGNTDLAPTGDAAGVTGFCTWTFDSATGTLTVKSSGAMADYEKFEDTPWYTFQSSIKKVVISDGVTSIGDYAFSYCDNLAELSLGKNVIFIGEASFSNTALTSVKIPDSTQTIGIFAFSDCPKLASVTIGKNVKTIKEDAFAYTGLTSVKIPDSVEEIGYGAFASNDKLTSVTFGKGVKTIGMLAFYATVLTSVTIPDSTETVEEYAFYSCTKLSSVTISKGVKTIERGAFYGTALKEVTIPANVTQIGDLAFGFRWIESVGEIPVENFRIKGYAGSAAQTYATANNIPFTTLNSECKIYFDRNGHGDGSMQMSVRYGDKVFKPADPVAAGWSFDGWFTDAACTTAYDFNSAVTADLTLYAKWKQVAAVPKITALTNVNSGVKLTIGKVNGTTKYRVFVKKSGKWKKLGDTTAATYTHKAVKSGYKYTYTVRGITKNAKKFTTGYNTKGWTTTFIATPKLPTLKNTKNGVKLTLKKVPGAQNYRVCRKTKGTGWIKVADTKKLSYVDKTAKKGVTYTYTIRCVSADGSKYTSGYNTKGRSIKCKR